MAAQPHAESQAEQQAPSSAQPDPRTPPPQPPPQPSRAQPDAERIPPIAECFPSSTKELLGELGVPERVIALSNGERVRLYDTTGPQGLDPLRGLPKRRTEWVAARRRR